MAPSTQPDLWRDLYLAPSPINGRGLFTRGPLAPGARAVLVSGPIMQHAYSEHFWQVGQNWIGIGEGTWVMPADDHPMSFSNHSCEPNTIVSEGLRLIALRPIAAGEELVLDYSTTELDPFWAMACTCGAARCRAD